MHTMRQNAMGQIRSSAAVISRSPTAAAAKIWRRTPALAAGLIDDCRGIAATEFAVIVPIMLVLFFGVVEVSNGVAAYRKVTIMAHTLADLTAQSQTLQDPDLTNIFCAASGIMTPYVSVPSPCITPPNPPAQTIMELWINPGLQARVQWSSGPGALPAGTVVTIPPQLAVANTYVIYSQVNYVYVPAVGYVLNKAGVALSDFAYTRPRQSQCVHYPMAPPMPNPEPTCPTT